MSVSLYVDDKRPCPPGWEVARTVTEAIRFLATREWAVCSLDHDIEYEVTVPVVDGAERVAGEEEVLVVDSPEDFTAVAHYLALMPADRRPAVQYHTANPAGRERLRAILSDAELPTKE